MLAEMGTVQNKSTAVPVLGTDSKKYLGISTRYFFKKYLGTGTVLGMVLCKVIPVLFLNDTKDLSFITCILKSASKHFQVNDFPV